MAMVHLHGPQRPSSCVHPASHFADILKRYIIVRVRIVVCPWMERLDNWRQRGSCCDYSRKWRLMVYLFVRFVPCFVQAVRP